MAAQTKHGMNLVKLIQDDGTDGKCRDDLEQIRWPNGPQCPRCESDAYRLEHRRQFECKRQQCRYPFSVTSGTIFHDSHLPLSKWFLATVLMIENRKRVSALQIKRELNIAYPTAWHLWRRIRKAMQVSYPCPPFKGINNRDNPFLFGDTIRKLVQSEKLTYERLMA